MSFFQPFIRGDGYCLLDFYYIWIWQAIADKCPDDAYTNAVILAHWMRALTGWKDSDTE